VTEFNESDGSEAPSGVSRRTVTKAMAWAVPVIAVSAAVPAYAASQINFDLDGAGCKLPGNSNSTYKGYAFKLVITNTSTVQVEINILSITLNGVSLGDSALVNLTPAVPTVDPNPFILAPGQSLPSAALLTEGAGNSSNGTLSITYTLNDGTPIVVTATVDAAPPINGASCQAFTAGEKLKLAAISGLPPFWLPNTVYPLSANVRISDAPGVILAATTAGTSGGTEPDVTGLAVGGTINDGTVVWTRIQ
jgi:hypothetical protein